MESENIEKIAFGFKKCSAALAAIGDETRQLILLTLLRGDTTGVRVGELARKTHLTRTSVSHHLTVLKEAHIVKMRKEGTKNFYYINCRDDIWNDFSELMSYINDSVQALNT